MTATPDGEAASSHVAGLATFMAARGTARGRDYAAVRGHGDVKDERGVAWDLSPLREDARLTFALRVAARGTSAHGSRRGRWQRLASSWPGVLGDAGRARRPDGGVPGRATPAVERGGSRVALEGKGGLPPKPNGSASPSRQTVSRRGSTSPPGPWQGTVRVGRLHKGRARLPSPHDGSETSAADAHPDGPVVIPAGSGSTHSTPRGTTPRRRGETSRWDRVGQDE